VIKIHLNHDPSSNLNLTNLIFAIIKAETKVFAEMGIPAGIVTDRHK